MQHYKGVKRHALTHRAVFEKETEAGPSKSKKQKTDN